MVVVIDDKSQVIDNIGTADADIVLGYTGTANKGVIVMPISNANARIMTITAASP